MIATGRSGDCCAAIASSEVGQKGRGYFVRCRSEADIASWLYGSDVPQKRSMGGEMGAAPAITMYSHCVALPH